MLLFTKVTAAVRILAYGYSSDNCDEYIKIAECTAIESLNHFCHAIIGLYEKQYLFGPSSSCQIVL